MAYLLFFDTETTGLPATRIPAPKLRNNWPDLVSIAWILTDETGRCLTSEYHIVQPSEWKIPEAASMVHHITNEIATRTGSPLKMVINRFIDAVLKADVVVSHNMEFDKNVIDNALYWRLGYGQTMETFKKRLFCTMNESTPLLKLPSRYPGKFKPPRLLELYQGVFHRDPPVEMMLHSAMGDTQVMMACFFKLWPHLLNASTVSTNGAGGSSSAHPTKIRLSLEESTETA
jgi:DNA polymerase III epsilon subunit-like protein